MMPLTHLEWTDKMKISYVMFDITNKCNYFCRHCYKLNKINEKSQELNCKSIIEFLNKIDQFGQTVRVILSGGEPLMYSSLYELLDNICDKHLVRLNTNAFYLDQHIVNLSHYPGLELQISLDGFNDESYETIRNNHFFSTVLSNACAAREKGINVFFRSTLTSKTIDNYMRFIELSEGVGIPVLLRPMIFTGEESQKELVIDYDKIVQWMDTCKREGQTKYSGDTLVSPHCPILNEEMTFSTLTVDVYGNVYPCILLSSKRFLMGNIYQNSVEQIFSDCIALKANILGIINHPLCKKCGFREKFGDGTCVISCFLNSHNCNQKTILQT